ncbi:MAG TPA: 50S ribosomal protein L9 [Blastocatellia bacterium]
MAHMDVLLKEDVDNLGRRGEVVRVRSGYGRNYLLPQGLAIEASAGNRRMIDEQKKVLVKQEERERSAAQGQADRLDGLELRFERRVGEHGILYGSVTVLDIVEALKEQGYTIERRRISLRDHIKEVGDYDVEIKLHREVRPVVKVKVRRPGTEEEEAATEQAAAQQAPEASSEPVEASAATAEAGAVEAAEAEETSQGEQ